MRSKRCSHCQKTKPLDAFYHHAGKKDGRTSWCSECLTEKRKKDRKPPRPTPIIPSLPGEEWRPIRDMPGYDVSNCGRVRSHKRPIGQAWEICEKPQRILSGGNSRGRPFVLLTMNGSHRAIRISVLVAEAFLGPRPEGCQVCHNDGNTKNNRAENLRYDSAAGNAADRFIHETLPFNETQVKRIRLAVAAGQDPNRIADRHGVCRDTIVHMAQGKTYSRYGGPRTKPNQPLPAREVRTIRHKREQGMLLKEIAQEHDLSTSMISRIVNGSRYANVP